jgi:hypothetical protein
MSEQSEDRRTKEERDQRRELEEGRVEDLELDEETAKATRGGLDSTTSVGKDIRRMSDQQPGASPSSGPRQLLAYLAA